MNTLTPCCWCWSLMLASKSTVHHHHTTTGSHLTHTHALHSYKFEFFDHDEKGRFWLLMQRYVKEVHVGGDASTASGGKRGSTGSTGSSGSKGRRRSVVDIVFRRKSSVASRGGRRGSSGSTGSGSGSSGFSAEALARVKEEVSAGVGDFTVTKFTRFGERVRLFVINLADSCLKSIDPSTGNTQKSFEFRHITEVACTCPLLAFHRPAHHLTSASPQLERVASHPARLRLRFDWATQRDYLVQFRNTNARESFCALLWLQRPAIRMTVDTEEM